MAISRPVLRMICPNCRMRYTEGSPYCSGCGAPLNDHAAAPDQPEATPAPEVLQRFLAEEQDVASVMQILQKASEILTYGEEIEYIATANKTLAGLVPDCVIATDRRLINYRKKLLGKTELSDCFWRDVRHIDIKEGRQGVLLRVATTEGWRLVVDSLPKAQASRLYEVGAQHNVRLQIKLKEMLAAASAAAQAPQAPQAPQVVVPSPVPPIEQREPDPAPVIPSTSEERFVQQGASPEPTPTVEPQPTPSTSGPLTGPLLSLLLPDTLILPSNTARDATQGLQEQPLIAEAAAAPALVNNQPPTGPVPVNDQTETTHSASRAMDDLDDLFFALLRKGKPDSWRPEEWPASEPTPKAQPEPPLPEERPAEPAEPPADVAGLLSYADKNQELSGHSSPSQVSNGLNGLNGNGEPNLHKTYGLPAVGFPQPKPAATTQNLKEPQKPQVSTTQKPEHAELPPEREHPSIEPRKTTSSSESPMRKLMQLKRMLDLGLITQADYEAKKVEILSRI